MTDRVAGAALLTAALIGAGLWAWAYSLDGMTVTLAAVGWAILSVALNGAIMVRSR